MTNTRKLIAALALVVATGTLSACTPRQVHEGVLPHETPVKIIGK